MASPPHADKLLVTGPVTRNVELALPKAPAVPLSDLKGLQVLDRAGIQVAGICQGPLSDSVRSKSIGAEGYLS